MGLTRTPEGPKPLPAPKKSRSYCHSGSAVMAPLLSLETLAPATRQVMGRCAGAQGPGIRSLQLVMPHSGRVYLSCLSPPLPRMALLGLACCSCNPSRAWLHVRRPPSSGITSWSDILAFAVCCAATLAFQRRGPEVKGSLQQGPGYPGLGRDSKRWAAKSHRSPGGWMGSVCTCTVQSSTTLPVLPLHPWRNFPLNLPALSSHQFSNSFVLTAEDTLAKLTIVLGYL